MRDHSSLQGKVVVITGASSGIGRATALEFAVHGTKVAIAARRDEKLGEVASEIRNKGSQAETFPLDVSDEKDVQALAATLVKKHGGAMFGLTMPRSMRQASLKRSRRMYSGRWWRSTCSGR